MATSLSRVNIHYVFSTKNKGKLIDKKIRFRLWAYMGGIAKQNNIIAHAAGGTEDHVHLLLTIPATISPSKAIQLIKAGSSKWVHEQFPEKSEFSWQRGYGAFSVSIGKLPQTVEYIKKQDEHHREKTFEEEFIHFLKANEIDYDERYVWG